MHAGSRSVQSMTLLTASVLVAVLFTMAPAAKSDTIDAQLDFGIEMARRGLWNEAIFRFARVLKERPGDVRVLNNMAVGYEAIGEFDKALEHYKRALEGDSANRELRRNYAQFVEFFESLKPKTDAEPDAPESEDGVAEGETASEATEAGDSASDSE